MNPENPPRRLQSSRLCNILQAWFYVSLLVGNLWSHPSHQVKWEEMLVEPGRVLLELRYEISEPRFTADLRERFDSDGNRRLSAQEQRALVDYVQMIALEDLHLLWDGKEVHPRVLLEGAYSLERQLPTAYPMNFHFRLQYDVPPVRGRHELHFADKESRWKSNFECAVKLGPGVSGGPLPRAFEFEAAGSFKTRVRF